MSTQLFRITKTKFANTAFDPNRTVYHAARWNPPGVPILYTAESESGAVLEILANVPDYDMVRNHYSIVKASLDDQYIHPVAPLPPESLLNIRVTRSIGKEWVASQFSVALRVPSIVSPSDFNVLLNPLHKDFDKLETSTPQSVHLDARLPLSNK